MLLKDRRTLQIIAEMKNLLLDSTNDIDIRINSEVFFFKPLSEKGFKNDEILFSIRYLLRKSYLRPSDMNPNNISGEEVCLTVEGYENWIFPRGVLDPAKVFLSHATEDKELAGSLKRGLEEFKINVFLAHDDIPGTVEWKDRLISELETCSVFIALRTKTYEEKTYTEQECGFAIALNKRVLSLFVGTTAIDSGFCAAIQGKSFETNDLNGIIEYCAKQLTSVSESI